MEKIKVSLVKTFDPYEGMRKTIELLGSLKFNIKGSHVLVKPNICSPFLRKRALPSLILT